MDEMMLWFGSGDGTLRSLSRLRYADGMIIFEFGNTSMRLGPKTK